ncbi:hypothetical protein SSX86_012156 [Deinandra increscens subsp. villosa]|uniref:Bifunctional inhibitor/plant lipid transfer protein/seed storage helical domain-containing protein n=1 Tax=Deinandra increscens subsp. villosa TaxID=3103831 RepID=A0AAP0D877_9ASTR
MKNCCSLVIVLILMTMLAMASAAPSAARCKKERTLAIKACNSVLYGRLPSPSCCLRIRVSRMSCICSVVTPKLAALIDPNRFAKLIEGCGRRLPHPFQCGSLTIP